MLDVQVTTTAPVDAEADLLVLLATISGEGAEGRASVGAEAAPVGEALGLDIADELAALDFKAATGESIRLSGRGRVAARTVLVVGAGAEADAEALRRAGAAVAGASTRQASAAIALPSVEGLDTAGVARALVEGLRLGGYSFATYKTDPDPRELESLTLLTSGDTAPVTDAVEAATVATAATLLVRDLVNLPPGDKRPSALAERAKQELAGSDVAVRVLEPDELRAGGYGGLLGVGAGSTDGPRLVQLDYTPDGAQRHVALVGKGITFDSGGLSLKPSESMETMKMDMGGAATVLGVVKAAAEMGLPVRLTGLMALAENMPSGSAIRPGDVLTIHGGKTVEVLNTDAEGRLVLADALEHAARLEPDVIIDLATLTGAAIVALGKKIGVLMSTDDDLAEALLAAGARVGEPIWRLPVAADEYRSKLDSEVADIKNTGGREAGTITAGLFLRHFVAEGIPWAHLDIAGLAWADDADGYVHKGGTGRPARLLLDWLAGA